VPVAAERPPGPYLRIVFLLAPVLLTVLLWVVTWWVAPRAVARELSVAATASLLGLGTTVIFGPAALGAKAVAHLSTWDLCWLVMYLTAATSFFYSFNLDLLYRLPWLGPRLRRSHDAARRTLHERPWIRRWATFGVGLFVLLPLPGSGSLGGSIVGRLIGLTRLRCFLTVTAAGVVVCLAYAWGGAGLAAWQTAHEIGIPVRLVSVAVALLAVWLLFKWIAHSTRVAPAVSPGPTPPADPSASP